MQENVSELGRTIDGDKDRDAIHIAIAPVVADEKLAPGQDVGFVKVGDRTRVGICDKPIGIVDPFLKNMVFPDQKFWMLLYPNTITSLRHDWSHPAFVVCVDKSASEQWMDEFAAKHRAPHEDDHQYTADELIQAGKEFLLHGDRMIQRGSESLRDNTNTDVFWTHFEVITGMKVADYHRSEVPFCCTC